MHKVKFPYYLTFRNKHGEDSSGWLFRMRAPDQQPLPEAD